MINYYFLALQGLPKHKIQSHQWAIKQTIQYRQSLKQIKQLNRLGFYKYKKVDSIAKPKVSLIVDPYVIKIQRVNHLADIKHQQRIKNLNVIIRYFAIIQNFMIRFYQGLSVQGVASQIGNFLRLYHESLAALVQGYREVTMDHEGKFKFDDGSTVQQRLDKFEQKLHETTTGIKQFK